MRPTSSLLKRSSKKAAALIIVLAFVVLLTGVALAYFSRTTSERQLAHSSYNDTSADLLARSALDIVIGDFKQEIVNGSTAPAPVIDGTTIYIPQGVQRVVPKRSGNPAIPNPADETTDLIPNLIRRSIRLNGVGELNAMPAPGLSSRASATNSTTASANGRSVSLARWNSHYLIPRDPSATGDDSTPVNTFVAPDWVLVTRNGPVAFSGWNPALKDPTSTNTTYAVGRYAYAVYDEGGLLDINVAGYPTSGANPTVTDIGRKGVLAFADLTALPTTPGNFLSTTAINKFILFRNYATMGGTGTLDSPITSAQASAFVDYYLGTTQIGTSQDFGQVNAISSNASGAPRTDQSFINRAELINFVKSTDVPPTGIVNTLQYLGTFSREQNKPTLPLTPAWPFTRVVVPQRFYLGNLNCVQHPAPASCSGGDADIRKYCGLQFASAGGDSPCDNQVRWKYVGNQDVSNTTPLSAIPAFPGIFTTTPLDLFQYINYALWGRIDPDSTHIASTLQIGASIIDQYDDDLLTTGIYFGSNLATCDTDPPINACLVNGADAGSAPPPPLPCVPSFPPYVPSNVFANRPLRSVGEFSYAYNLLDAINNNNGSYYLTDFKDAYNSTSNPDPALLDFFTFNSASVRSGIVSLNTRQPRVLAALLKGAIYNNNNASSSVVNNIDAITAANSIVKTNYASTTYALSRADIANLSKTIAVTNAPFTNDDPPLGTRTSEARETIARALSEVVQTRTWGLLIDVVAQTGHYKPNATGLADFVVEGEKRYWLHVAIDRFDGTIVGQQLEEVVE